MRGGIQDVQNTRVQKAPSMGTSSVPYDRFVLDLNVLNPIQATPQDLNPRYIMASRRYRPDDRIDTSAQTTIISLDPSVPNTLVENGNTPIPRAGIFKYILGSTY